MDLDEITQKLTYLMDRQEIYDVVARYCRATDRLDRRLMRTVYHADAIDDHTTFVGGADAFFDWWADKFRTSYTSSNHLIGNQTVDIDGTTAHVETYYIWAGQNLEGAPFSLFGGRYIDRMEKRDGRWAILARDMITDWAAPSVNDRDVATTAEGAPNAGILTPAEAITAAGATRPAADRSDPSYQRPLIIAEERLAEAVAARTGTAC